MPKYFINMQLKYFERKLVVHFDASELSGKPEEIELLVAEFANECRRQLPMELRRGPTHREAMSLRIKRGIQAAKERRKQRQQPQ